jgi:preprotein translocase subunit SecG
MTVFPFLAVGFIMSVVAVLFVICCVALVLIVLIQKGRGGGLSGAFGGAMAGGILGSKTGDFLTWVTVALVGVFLTLAVVMAKFYKPSTGDYGADQPPQQGQTTDTGQTTAVDDTVTTTSDANRVNDTNLPGS